MTRQRTIDVDVVKFFTSIILLILPWVADSERITQLELSC